MYQRKADNKFSKMRLSQLDIPIHFEERAVLVKIVFHKKSSFSIDFLTFVLLRLGLYC